MHLPLSTIVGMLRTPVLKGSCVHSSLTGSMLEQQIYTPYYRPA
jgi:hypothetical protein